MCFQKIFSLTIVSCYKTYNLSSTKVTFGFLVKTLTTVLHFSFSKILLLTDQHRGLAFKVQKPSFIHIVVKTDVTFLKSIL